MHAQAKRARAEMVDLYTFYVFVVFHGENCRFDFIVKLQILILNTTSQNGMGAPTPTL